MKNNISFDPKSRHLENRFSSKLTRLPMENITNRFTTSTEFQQNQRIDISNFQEPDIAPPTEPLRISDMNHDFEPDFERPHVESAHFLQNLDFLAGPFPPPEKMYLPPPETLPVGVIFEFDDLSPTFDDPIQLEPLPSFRSLF